MSLKVISRNEIIQRKQALIRSGNKQVFLAYDHSHRLKERANALKTLSCLTTTYRSRLISPIYESVFCSGGETGKRNGLKIRRS